MSRFKRFALAGLFIGLPLATTACRIDIGNGCTAIILEEGVQFGVVCNPF